MHSNGWLLTTKSEPVYTAPLTDEDNNLIIPNITMIQLYRFVSTWAAPESLLGKRVRFVSVYCTYGVPYSFSAQCSSGVSISYLILLFR